MHILERQSENLSAFLSEKRMVIGQFIIFALSFALKCAFNAFLISKQMKEQSDHPTIGIEITSVLVTGLWAGVPITYSFV